MKLYGLSGTKISSAFISACINTPYNTTRFLKDLIAGITVGIIAIPLAMALAIASGVAPQHGLYTAIIAGFVIALTGGSRFSVSGPTAAFVVILYPVSIQFGLSGLLIATLLSGIFLILMGIIRLGRLIEYIPLPVVLGFTSGIAITIATMQIKDFFGLTLEHMPENYINKVIELVKTLPKINISRINNTYCANCLAKISNENFWPFTSISRRSINNANLQSIWLSNRNNWFTIHVYIGR